MLPSTEVSLSFVGGSYMNMAAAAAKDTATLARLATATSRRRCTQSTPHLVRFKCRP